MVRKSFSDERRGSNARRDELKHLNRQISSDSEEQSEKIVDEKKGRVIEDFDDIISIVGSQGKYQKFLLYAVLGPIFAMMPVLSLNTIFMFYEPDHWCHVPGRDNETSIDVWKNLTIPWERGPDDEWRLSQCKMKGPNDTILDCNAGWEYDHTDFEETMPSEFDWVCDKSHYATDAFTMAAAGNAFGTIVYGMAADKIGRKPIFFLCILLNIFGRIISLFVPSNFTIFQVLQFILNSGLDVMFFSPCMIAAEVSDKDFRGWIYSSTWMVWVIGMCILPLLSWLCADWFKIGLLTSVPGILLFLYLFWMPESPRWLVSVGKTKKAAAIIRKIAKVNGTVDNLPPGSQLEDSLNQLYKKQQQSNAESGIKIGFWTLFSRRRLAINTIMLTFAWITNGIIYYSITLNVSNLSGNQFVNFFILAFVELPSGYLGSILVDRIGRRWTQVAFFFFCGLSSVTAGIFILFPSAAIVSTIAAVVAKFAVTLTFLVVYLQATEIFPTNLRSTGSGFACTVTSIVAIVTPYIVYLAKYNLGAPWFTMACLAFLGMICSACLPETLYQTLPETVEEANDFGKHHSFWSFLPNTNKITSRSSSAGTEEEE